MRNLHIVEQEFQDVDRRDAPTGTQAIDRAAHLLTLVLDSDETLGVGDLPPAPPGPARGRAAGPPPRAAREPRLAAGHEPRTPRPRAAHRRPRQGPGGP